MKKIHRKVLFKNKIIPFPSFGNSLTGSSIFYFISSENKLIHKNEIEASRIVISRELRKLKSLSKKKKNFWALLNFNLPYTKKSAQSRMGKGKGAIDSYKCYVNINTIIFKLRNISTSTALRIYNLISSKLSFSLHLYVNNFNLFYKVI
jgi:large subunit ribosomal protein L16